MLNNIIDNFKTNEPILISDIIKFSGYSRPRVNQIVSECINSGKLARFCDGVFYAPTNTILGKSTLDIKQVIKRKYLEYNGNIFGIYAGLSLLNAFGITTQVPSVYEIITNNESTRVRKIVLNGQNIVLRKSRCKITKSNYKIYALLELLNLIDIKDNIDYDVIINYIKKNNIKYKDMVKYLEFFPAKVSKNLNRSELIYATL